MQSVLKWLASKMAIEIGRIWNGFGHRSSRYIQYYETPLSLILSIYRYNFSIFYNTHPALRQSMRCHFRMALSIWTCGKSNFQHQHYVILLLAFFLGKCFQVMFMWLTEYFYLYSMHLMVVLLFNCSTIIREIAIAQIKHWLNGVHFQILSTNRLKMKINSIILIRFYSPIK